MPERANHPGGSQPAEKVRELQHKLYRVAKSDRKRHFHALWDRVCRSDVLAEAWKRVRSNGGAAGVDGETLADIKRRGVHEFLAELAQSLKAGTYRPQPVKRRYIPKPDGKQRPLGIPTIRDRVAQMAVKIVIEPIFEAGFQECSYGFRPKRSATQALEKIRLIGGRRHRFVVDGLGSPQGGVISPLLANIFLDSLDREWARSCAQLGILVRHADDFVVLCETKTAAEEAKRRLEGILGKLRLTLHPTKSRLVDLGVGKDGFTFLGFYLRIVRSRFRTREYLFRWPSPKSMNRIRDKVREKTNRKRRAGMKELVEVIEDLNPVLRGWGNYFRTGNASTKFQQVDRYVRDRIVRLLRRRGGQRAQRVPLEMWTWNRLTKLGLHRLIGTIRYPGEAHAA